MSEEFVIRDAAPDDLDWILALNKEHETELSPLGRGDLALMLDQAALARVAAPEAAFLIAFDADADYDRENFLWFRERQHRFLYVDRVAVSAVRRRLGLARRLYRDLFDRARRADYQVVCAEVNASIPPTRASALPESK